MGNITYPPQGYIRMFKLDVRAGAERYLEARGRALTEHREKFIQQWIEKGTGYKHVRLMKWIWPWRENTRAEAEAEYVRPPDSEEFRWDSYETEAKNRGLLWAKAVAEAGMLAARSDTLEEMMVSLELATCLTGEQV